MGNAASREAAKQVQRASGKGAKAATAGGKAPRPPPLGRSHANTPDKTEDAEKALKERQQKETMELSNPEVVKNTMQPATRPPQRPPQPDINSGFFRGQISDPRDVAQEKFLIHQSGAKNEMEQLQQQELAPDLLKFLQDAGPLEKKINKKLTSPRIVKELEKGKAGEESERMHRFEAAERTRESHRLVEGIEGHSTLRTTNYFTSSNLLVEEEKDFGLTDLELYELLRRQSVAEKEAGPQGSELSKTFHAEKLDGAVEWTDEERQAQEKLLTDAMNVLALPVVVKDTDGTYVGLHQKELDKEFAHQKIDVVDESRVKLVLADLTDLGSKEIRRIR